MKTFIATTLFAIMASVAQGAPAPQLDGLLDPLLQVDIIFEGATGGYFFLQSFPADGSHFTIYNPLSVSHIYSNGGVSCTFSGADGSTTFVEGSQTVDVGPPQVQVGGSCFIL